MMIQISILNDLDVPTQLVKSNFNDLTSRLPSFILFLPFSLNLIFTWNLLFLPFSLN